MPRRDASHIVWGLAGVILEPDSELPLFIQVAYLAFGVIIGRRMPAGSPLPSEPSLAARWNIDRQTVRKAFALLREQGIIDTRRGVGHFVAFEPQVRRIMVAPGTRVATRPPTPQERADLVGVPWGSPVLVVEEPGKNPVAYDGVSTVIYT